MSTITQLNFTKFVIYLLPVAAWLGPPLVTLQYVMYFWFVDDVMLSLNGPYGASRVVEVPRVDSVAEIETTASIPTEFCST